MKRNRGITLIALIVTIIVLLILAGMSISIITDDMQPEMTIKELQGQEKCEHDWVITSKYDFVRESYRTITKCSKCGKEVM